VGKGRDQGGKRGVVLLVERGTNYPGGRPGESVPKDHGRGVGARSVLGIWYMGLTSSEDSKQEVYFVGQGVGKYKVERDCVEGHAWG